MSSKDNIHYFDSNNGGTWRKANISTAYAHTGNFSVAFDGKYGYLGKKLTGLKKNTNYTISFYSLIKGATDATVGSFKVTKTDETVYNANGKSKAASEFIAASDKKYGYYDNWGKCTMEFNTGDNTEVIFWIYHDKLGIVYLDNFAVFESVAVEIASGLGGNAYADFTDSNIPKGSVITFSATPLEGNTFDGWYDNSGTKVSTSQKYKFTVTEPIKLTAYFNGPNKPPRDEFLIRGLDGTFESYSDGALISGWHGYEASKLTDLTWASYRVVDLKADKAKAEPKYPNCTAYEGDKALVIGARYNNSVFDLDGLLPNADYRFSFYVFQPDADRVNASIPNIAVIGENDVNLSNKIYSSVKKVETDSGWNKVTIYFNSESDTSVRLFLRYDADKQDTKEAEIGALLIDNFELYQYSAPKEVVNGDFEDGAMKWYGNTNVVPDGDNNVLALNQQESAYNNVAVDEYSSYVVSFKAKGNITAAAMDMTKVVVNPKNYISSVSYLDVDNDTWNEYSFKVYSGVQKSMNIAFKANEDGAMIDDVKIEKQKNNAGSIIECIDFESDRFALTKASSYSMYYSTAPENDPYVYSGKASLKFTYNELLENTSEIFDEAWLSYQPVLNGTTKVSMKYKIVDGISGGAVGLAPEYSGTYGGESGFEHISKTDEWQSISFYVNNTTHAVFKAKINSVAGSTSCDFYIDDIVISVAPPMVSEENSKMTYCERLYNTIDNEGFESAPSAADWKGLPTTAKVIKGDALKGKHFLRASAGTHYVLEVPVSAGVEYYFAASVRGTATTVGSIGVTVDKEGTNYYANRDEEPASIVEFDSEEKGWKRKGFRFITDGSGIAYVTIDVTSGALDIDSVMMFTTDYGYRYDPNDYTVYVPYDYDNLKSSTTVINGGFGEQPYYDGDVDGVVDDTGSPSTGDSVAMPVMIIVLAVVASFVLMFIRKRREGADNA